jgi:rod shape-determining protein MreC
VVKGAGVITGKGVVGVIDAVSEHHSYARSFKNHEMSVSSRLGKDGFIGPMSWDGSSSSRAILKEIPHHAEVAPGDTVYTSGFSTIFPADIPIGTTGEAEIVNGSTYEIEVILFEDFGKLKYVTIVENIGRKEIEELEDEI